MRCQPCSGAGRIAAAFRLLPAGRVSAPDDPCIGRFEKEVAWLRDCHGSGATLACTCTAAMMLAQTGLLDGMEATIHWNYAPSLAKHYPCLKVDPDKALVVTGEDNRIVMAGGGTSHLDLILYLIARLGFVTVETQNGQELFTIPYMIQRVQ